MGAKATSYISLSLAPRLAWYVIGMHEHVHVRVYMWVTVYKR